MKVSTLFLSIFVLCAVAFQSLAAEGSSSSLNWYTNYDQAVQQAKSQQKPLLLFFTGSDWCQWCKKLESEVLMTDQFAKEVGDKYVFVRLDFPMYTQQDPATAKQNQALQKKFNVRNFPMVILLDPDGRQIGVTGYRSGGPLPYSNHLNKIYQDYQGYKQKMSKLDSANYSGKELKQLYQKANEFGLEDDANLLVTMGSESSQRHFFLTERYRQLAREGLIHSPEASSIRQLLSTSDPQNKQLTHYQLAVIDFSALSDEMENSQLPAEVIVSPLINYIQRYGDTDEENLWRLNMIVAQVFSNQGHWDQALQFAKASYSTAPQAFQPDIATLIASIETQSH